MRPLFELVRGKTVALVGNAASILARDDGAAIDSHEIVVRMNMGISNVFPRDAIGSRTDVWATAKHWQKCCPPECRLVLFMKLTELGDFHWEGLRRELVAGPTLVRWPRELEDECREFVGADPGTGIRLLWWLKRHAEPAHVGVFGMDCWTTTTHWSGRKNTPNHHPDKERAAMVRLMHE